LRDNRLEGRTIDPREQRFYPAATVREPLRRSALK
jgi:hypothetical protein